MCKTKEIPTLNEEKIGHAVSVIPADNWKLNFWTCHEEGHITFNCLLLSVSQLVYLSHRYYLHQIEPNP